MRRTVITAALLMLFALALSAPLLAEEEEKPGTLAWVVYFEPKDGMGSQLEEGMKAHNAVHAEHGDPVPVFAWQVVTGESAGNYVRASFGHHWKDFDGGDDPAMQAADQEDVEKNINPYVDSATPQIWSYIGELSNMPTGPMKAMGRLIAFDVRYGHEDAFRQAVGKIHAALSKQEWDPYIWYELVDGGTLPQFMVVLPRDGFAGFAPGDRDMGKAMMAEYGEGAKQIMQDFQATVASMHSQITAYRPDLSYLPQAASE